MIAMKIAKGEWGGLHFSITFKKIDLLPKFTIAEMDGCLILDFGFLMFNLNLCVLSEEFREFQRKLESGELEKELNEKTEMLAKMIEKMKQQKDDSL